MARSLELRVAKTVYSRTVLFQRTRLLFLSLLVDRPFLIRGEVGLVGISD